MNHPDGGRGTNSGGGGGDLPVTEASPFCLIILSCFPLWITFNSALFLRCFTVFVTCSLCNPNILLQPIILYCTFSPVQLFIIDLFHYWGLVLSNHVACCFCFLYWYLTKWCHYWTWVGVLYLYLYLLFYVQKTVISEIPLDCFTSLVTYNYFSIKAVFPKHLRWFTCSRCFPLKITCSRCFP